jgi:hypothetical protein
MHPVLKRILINGGLTAILLAGVGLMFAQIAAPWAGANRTESAASAATVPDTVRVNVPLMMAFWGFLFVAVSELILWRLRGLKRPTPSVEKQPDETEKLLNELLARAEAARQQETGDRSQGSEDREQKTEDRGQTAEEQKAG